MNVFMEYSRLEVLTPGGMGIFPEISKRTPQVPTVPPPLGPVLPVATTRPSTFH